MDVDTRVSYTQRLLRVSLIKKYKTILAECKETARGIGGYQWKLGEAKYVTTEQF